MTLSRSLAAQGSSFSPPELSASVADLVRIFTDRLFVAIELATQERAREIAATVLAQVVPAGAGAARDELALEGEELRHLKQLADDFLQALEQPLQARMGELLKGRLSPGPGSTGRVRGALAGSPVSDAEIAVPTRRPTRRRKPTVRLPPPPDPEQQKRDAEAARLRALLRPTVEETPAVPAPPPAVAAPLPTRPTTPGDLLRALEKEIQDAVPSLGALGPERCAAQIAAWTGTVRELRDRLPAEVSAAMRPAFRIFLEHLTHLREAMEAHVVDALEPSWSTPDWGAYIEVNRARVEGRSPDLPADRLELHHRTMLRALLKPHRRNVPQQAHAVISAAVAALPPSDAQLRAATRRHAVAWEKQVTPPPPSTATAPTQKPAQVASQPVERPAAGTPSALLEAGAELPAISVIPVQDDGEAFVSENGLPLVPVEEANRPAENEFDLPWTQ